ncbi:MAG TPA: hypothetical protein ENI22_01525 [Candidatus Pacearchaeota archaeon]|nr:hypothetical protein [Candidatus Pacearchaeota archaeon]
MNFKNMLKNSWKVLPVVSLFRYDHKDSRDFSFFGKLFSHTLYASMPAAYLYGSLFCQTPNPSRWSEILKERRREAQEYSQLYNQAVECVDTKLGFHPRKWQIELPRLKEGVLEGIAESCETEEGKIR